MDDNGGNGGMHTSALRLPKDRVPRQKGQVRSHAVKTGVDINMERPEPLL